MRVAFLGNHTVGVRALQALNQNSEVVGVVAHPEDPEDGIRYDSVFAFAKERGWDVMRGKAKDAATNTFIEKAKPDLLWITDYRYLVPASVLSLSRLGAVNLHPSLLPKYRGRASINWALLQGETRLGLTAHFVDEGMDTGDIIEQTGFQVSDDWDVGDCLEVLYPLYADITRRVLGYFHSGRVPRRPQDHSQATEFPRRKPEDGRVDWRQSSRSIRNLIRAVAAPYPGAFTTCAGKNLTIWKALPSEAAVKGGVPGLVLDVESEGTTVQCGEGVLLLSRVEGTAVKPGSCLGT